MSWSCREVDHYVFEFDLVTLTQHEDKYLLELSLNMGGPM